jgi:hypothetical protein
MGMNFHKLVDELSQRKTARRTDDKSLFPFGHWQHRSRDNTMSRLRPYFVVVASRETLRKLEHQSIANATKLCSSCAERRHHEMR